MNIIDHLTKEHEEVKKLFKALEKKPDDTAKLEELTTMLKAHMEGEEKVFYPELVDDRSTREIVLEGYEEHLAANLYLKDMLKKTVDGDVMKAKIKVMMEIVEHHVEEEETQMFPKAQKVLKLDKLEELDAKYEKVEQKYMK